jgi:hypothetical protein
VDASNLYVVAGHIFAHYVEAVEKSFYVSPGMQKSNLAKILLTNIHIGVINDFTVLCLKDSEDKNSILACQDRCFRVLSVGRVCNSSRNINSANNRAPKYCLKLFWSQYRP